MYICVQVYKTCVYKFKYLRYTHFNSYLKLYPPPDCSAIMIPKG